MNSPTPPNVSSSELDDIMSSIRDSVAAEGEKVGSGNDDLLNAAAAADAALETEADDILELTPAELTAPTEPVAGDNADILTDILGVPSLPPADDSAADEFDKLLAEIGQEKQQRVADIQAQKNALLADIEPLGTEPAPTTSEVAAEAEQDIQDTQNLPVPTTPTETSADLVAPSILSSSGYTHSLGTIEGEGGEMQLVLPAEVLAVALRPMVQTWLAANLPSVVEKLVQAEIAKLNQ